MKNFALLLLLAVFTNCGTTKKQTEKDTRTKMAGSTIGIIHVNEDGCPLYIEVTSALNNNETVPFNRAYPLNLLDKMKKKGLKVEFTYTLSKAMQPEGCTADAVIQLNVINVIP
jgi:hypothetical protein